MIPDGVFIRGHTSWRNDFSKPIPQLASGVILFGAMRRFGMNELRACAAREMGDFDL